jgi:hypothetical protein
MAITRPKIIEPERNLNLICNLSLYTHIPNFKSISQSIAKKRGDNCFISELRTYMSQPLIGGDIKKLIILFKTRAMQSVAHPHVWSKSIEGC